MERLERQASTAVAAGADVDIYEWIDQLDANLVEPMSVGSDLPLDQQVYRQSLGVT